MRAVGSRIALCFLAFCLAKGAVAQTPAIEYVEPIALALKSGTAQFDAYGRRFSLTLTDNDRVLNKLSVQRKSELARYRMLRGSLDGAPGSWVRLTEYSGFIEGAIWDGHDLYTVTRYETIAPFVTNPIDAAPGQSVVYRLSDSRDVLPRDFCALAGDAISAEAASKAANGLDQYRAVVQGIESGLITPTITRQIEISLIADTDFQAAEAVDPTGAMLARLNIVEGIFSEQIGLLVLATDVRLIPAGNDPFTSTSGSTLLEQLGTYRAATPEVRARGLAHLLTGKDLDGTTAGIAYVRTVCDVERGASLSSRSFGTTISALIMAHELGHNFGAGHDGEPGTSCASVGGGFIMAPSVSGYTTFSQCSIDTMAPVIASASCITPAEYADVTVETGATSVTGEGGVPFTLPFVVRSKGNVGADDAVLTVTLPNNAAFTVDSAASSIGSCSVAGLNVTCALGSLAPDASAQVSVNARSSSAAKFVVQARVTAANDRVTSNNNRQLSVSIRSGVDIAVALSTSALKIAIGAPFEVYADVSSLRAMPVRNGVLSLSLNQAVTSASMPGAVCTTNASSVTCTLADLPSGTTRRLTVQATAQAAGSVFAGINVSAADDGDFTNNNANASAWVQAERDVELTAGPAVVDLAVGAVYEVPYTLVSRGPLATGDVALTISVPSIALAVDSIDAGGSTCTQADANTWHCELGSLAPGATRAVRLRVHGARPATSDINAV
ncbi:MAG: M12 family metallo-peptidase, partial [Pseudomonadota bacterium]